MEKRNLRSLKLNLRSKLLPFILFFIFAPYLSADVPLWGDKPHKKPKHVRGIHLTSWVAGSPQLRPKFEVLFAETELNTAVIDVKEVEGDVYIYDVYLEGDILVSTSAMSRPKSYIKYLKDRGVYTVARVVVFKDNLIPKLKPEWAVKSSSPLPKALEKGFQKDIWVDDRGHAWIDPYNEKGWDYIVHVASQAAALGFQEIQFDYIRFPSDGNTKWARYPGQKEGVTPVDALADFLKRAHQTLDPMGVLISIDTFGMAGSNNTGLGIGQDISQLLNHIDVISPMMYPSHYGAGEFGIADPNSEPYETINRSIRDTKKILSGSKVVLRPYLQDFSLGVKYDAEKVRAQIQALEDNGIHEWLLWNPLCRYTREALRAKSKN